MSNNGVIHKGSAENSLADYLPLLALQSLTKAASHYKPLHYSSGVTRKSCEQTTGGWNATVSGQWNPMYYYSC